ncbi:MAG TPA: vWA domain-containing protein, partial [Planctomycetaceae bacterium]|nr:vWA domain-containing protein [Planctomycetaceae bacterium]
MNRTHCIIVLWLFRLPQIGVADDIPPITAPPPKLYRLVVIDDSGSMATDNRIGMVRDELTKQLQQLPPSREYPIAIVTFGSSAKPAKTFFDLKSATEFLGTLNASSGGTSIAAGLAEANAELKNATTVSSVWVMLYSDGEDSDST